MNWPLLLPNSLESSIGSSIDQLDESGTPIGNMVKVIYAIAEQVNLLALNATIEAVTRSIEIAERIAGIASAVEETAAVSTSSHQGADELVAAATELKRIVSHLPFNSLENSMINPEARP